MTGTAPPRRESNETHVPTKQQATQTDARLSGTHEHPGGPAGAEAAAREGAQTADRQHSAQTAVLTPRPIGQRLPKSRRIRKRVEYVTLQRVGRRRAGRCFIVIAAPAASGLTRLGITASRRVGGAVVRNRVKRLVRDFFRRHQGRIRPAQDVLVIARPDAAAATYADVKRELAGALRIHDA
jgi:ribonuclease P protein component